MCGIAGIIHCDPVRVRQALAEMVCVQAHRGPDDEGCFIVDGAEATVGLGHRRLSILDLSPLGHQPMVHPVSGDALVFNGEIYNFQTLRSELQGRGCRFQGHSDTEVLLHALVEWGSAAIARLQGMFALAFYDRRQQRLLLARDPMGIKPLYIHRQPGLLAFASEVRGILACGMIPADLDRRALAGFLAFGAVQEPLTIIRDIQAFPPACWQWIGIHDVLASPSAAPTRYWRVPPPQPTKLETVIPQLQQTLEQAVADHLVSDVPVGVFLSAGLDSTVIAALAARAHAGIRSFTVGFADQPDMSETGLATETAALLNLQHTNISLDETLAARLAQEWMARLDQPSMDGLNVYVISEVIRSYGIKVALSGQGGDELFGGYSSFLQLAKIRQWWRWFHCLPRFARSRGALLVSTGRSEAVQQKMRDMMLCDGSILSLYLHRRRAMSNRQLGRLGLSSAELGLTDDFMPAAATQGMELREDDVVWSISKLEARLYQGNTLLRDTDTNGMAHGLEIRVPFLDQRVLDLVMALPGDFRLPPGKPPKYLLRTAFISALRPELLRQPKRGFTLPIRRWMAGKFRELCEASLLRLKAEGLIEARGIDGIWNGFLSAPESPIWSRAWSLCVLGMYLEHLKSRGYGPGKATNRPIAITPARP